MKRIMTHGHHYHFRWRHLLVIPAIEVVCVILAGVVKWMA